MDVPQWSQQVLTTLPSRPMDKQDIENTTPPNNINPNNNTNSRNPQQQQQQGLERRKRPKKEENINCPRCNSSNTKFCYYNNYSLTQPRFFCKTCRRYWTQGGSLRSVPVGGGSRKNKRPNSLSTYATSSISQPPPPPQSQPISLSSTPTPPPNSNNNNNKLDLNPPTSLSHLLTTTQNPNMKFLQSQDLNLSFPIQGLFNNNNHQIDHQLPKIESNNNTKIQNYGLPFHNNNNNISSNNNNDTCSPISALELLRNGFGSRGGLNPFISDLNTVFQTGYPNLQEFKPSINMFSSPSLENSDNNARLLFPFADMNKLASTTNNDHDDDDQSKDNNNNNGSHDDHQHGYWSGMLGGGTW